MLKYNIASLEEEFDVKLDDDQKKALSSLTNFLESKKFSICLSGVAGTGKSLCIKMLLRILKQNNKQHTVCTPTNKAKTVLCDYAFTIHSVLNLRPNLNILDFDASNMEFVKGNIKVYSNEIFIVDECSMINDDLYQTMVELVTLASGKIIWVGDEKQLSPVKQNYISKTFTESDKITLTTVHRQKKSVLYKVLEYLRNKPLRIFKSVEEDDMSLLVYDDIKTMLSSYAPLFKFGSDAGELNFIKLIAYTNKRIQALNEYIRKLIYNDYEEYHVGEILTGYDNCQYKSNLIENSKDYIITKVSKSTYSNYPAYDLILSTGENEIPVKVLSKNLTQKEYTELAKELEERRLEAIAKPQHGWRTFYVLNHAFLTPVDLVYNNRVIKRKSIDYGYCISVHKSQGSTYQNVLIDMMNILRCQNNEELRQMQYVACSRTSGNLLIYFKNDS